MNNIIRSILVILIVSLIADLTYSEEYKYANEKSALNLKQTAAECAPASGFDWLDLNNVRARINTGGDMWWDLNGIGRYYIPKAGSATSVFAGALWIGGLDINNQLKLCAQRYRQVGIDFWTGPLKTDGTASISEAVCAEYDKFFRMDRLMIDDFTQYVDFENNTFSPPSGYVIPHEIRDWPAHGDEALGQAYYLAPFYDLNNDGEYDPEQGDFPYYDLTNELCHTKIPTYEEELDGTIQGSILADQVIKGDETLWWVFNDKGGIHTETNGAAIGLEIRAQAFAFATNDEINNMTFYSYEIINRSTYELTQTYFCPWIDTDLGFARDDFVGCDVQRGLGYCYNGKDIDGSGEVESYGAQPPAVGVDFFQGPYMDPDNYDNPGYGGEGDGPRFVDDPSTSDIDERCQIVSKDGIILEMENADGTPVMTRVESAGINGVNFGNGIVDDERFGMRRFVYHNNSGGIQGDPQIAPEYYNYLRGIWRDGTPMLYGGTAHFSGAGTVGPECYFMFPFDSDPCNWGTNGIPPNGGWNTNGKYWSEETGNDGSPNPPADRRFMQSAGPFTLKPGAVNYITVGIPWARAQSGGAFASVQLLRAVDDKCQALFDNCFKVIDGPTAPDMVIQELDRKLIFYISNSPNSNNYQEAYEEFDPNIIQPLPGSEDDPVPSDAYYRFEGYQIFQVANEEVGPEEFSDPDKARLVAQFDIKNGVGKIVNYYFSDEIGANVPVIEVNGQDNGISHSFVIEQDAFATGDVQLVNNKHYYYYAIAYAYNNYLPFGLEYPNSAGQKLPYLSGRKNIGDRTKSGNPYSAMPHKIVNGIIMNSEYGDQPQITRIAGRGNGGLNLDLTQETVDEIMSKPPAGPDNIFGGPDYPIAYNPVYKVNAGPINVQVINPLTATNADYIWYQDTLVKRLIENATGQPEVRGDTISKMVGYWTLYDVDDDIDIPSDATTFTGYEQLLLDAGISVKVEQPFYPGPVAYGQVKNNNNAWKDVFEIFSNNNGLIEATIQYADSSHQWLSGIEDIDVPGDPLDWIRSGTHNEDNTTGNPANNDWNTNSDPPNPWDPGEVYEKMLNGTWAPFCMTAYSGIDGVNVGATTNQSDVGPAIADGAKSASPLSELASVDIVFTKDKSLWTRSPVLEMGYDAALAEGNATKFSLRAAPSVDKDGNPGSIGEGPSENEEDPNYISDHGMGWFPGYAINVETGERMNIMFGEDSYLVGQNGRDMLFNPPKRTFPPNISDPEIVQKLDPNIFSGIGLNQSPVFGGKHYVYIVSHKSEKVNFGPVSIEINMPAYDAGRYAVSVLDTIYQSTYVFTVNQLFSSVMYVGMPMGVEGEEWLDNDVKIRIRIARPYERGYAATPLDTVYPGMDINNYYPMYEFKTDGFEVEKENPEKSVSDLDIIRVVPNPYYAYSYYENNALDNRVRITNLPEECTITIYNVSGTKIRQFTKASPETTLDWDLKNFANVPISGGVYYLHITSPKGEKVVKFFCTMRVPDMNTF